MFYIAKLKYFFYILTLDASCRSLPSPSWMEVWLYVAPGRDTSPHWM